MIPAWQDALRILPELVLSGFAILLILMESFFPEGTSRRPLCHVAAIGTLLALWATWYSADFQGLAFGGMIRNDAFSLFFHLTVLLASLLSILLSSEYLELQKIHQGEWYALILLGTTGMCLMSSANDLILIFIALEISSISTYILAAFRRGAAESAEAGLKYFLLGSFATAFFLYGAAMAFGATGSTNIDSIAAGMRAHPTLLAQIATALILVGVGFKISAAPFHLWTPDVYEGAPVPASALLSTGPKAAAFAVLLRILLGAAMPNWFWPLWFAAVLSMSLGNIGALLQTNVKRVLAYSSIAHAGYMLCAVAACAQDRRYIAAVLFYATAYTVTNLGAFGVVSHLCGSHEKYTALADYAGLAKRSPGVAALFTIFLLSLTGIPLTAGFFAKFYAFSATLGAGLIWLTIIGLANSALAAFYYLKLIFTIYFDESGGEKIVPRMPWTTSLALGFCLLATLWLGIAPAPLLRWAEAAATLFQ